MKVLIVGDVESKALYDCYEKSRLQDVDLILITTTSTATGRPRAASAWRKGSIIIRACG